MHPVIKMPNTHLFLLVMLLSSPTRNDAMQWQWHVCSIAHLQVPAYAANLVHLNSSAGQQSLPQPTYYSKMLRSEVILTMQHDICN